jgi:hypothetical protein
MSPKAITLNLPLTAGQTSVFPMVHTPYDYNEGFK